MHVAINTLVDNAPLVNVMAVVEGIKGIIGWMFLAFYIVKYRKLYKLNANHTDVKVDGGVTSANDEVRQSVVVQLTSAVEVEDPKAQKG